MKVGGNASATDFFSKNGGAAALNSKDAKVKYTSRAAVAYKDELKRRAANDARVHPDTVIADDIGQQEDEGRKSEDFFESWDKPIVHKPTPPPSRTATPPVGRTPSPANGPPTNGKPTTTNRSNLSVESAAPRTTTSSALRSSKTAASTGARRTGVLGAKKPQKLAVKKVAETISFEDAEKAAKAEAELIEKWGADEVELKKPDPLKSFTTPAISSNASSTSQKASAPDVGRLGMGMRRLGFGMVANAPTKESGPIKTAPCNLFSVTVLIKPAEPEETFARAKFGNQKGISSDQFFGRGEYDPAAASEARGRLQQFDGATSISSNQYFGREEEAEPHSPTVSSYSELEANAKDFARRIMNTSGDDIEKIRDAIGQGAQKLQNYLQRYGS
jgi:ADP-ribosylation factor GTPase-activating protein 2/3